MVHATVMVLALAAGLLSGDVVLGLTLLVIGCPGALVMLHSRGDRSGNRPLGPQRDSHQGRRVSSKPSRKILAVAVDKTGTLTEGRPALTDIVVLNSEADRREVLRWAATPQKQGPSTHLPARSSTPTTRRRSGTRGPSGIGHTGRGRGDSGRRSRQAGTHR